MKFGKLDPCTWGWFLTFVKVSFSKVVNYLMLELMFLIFLIFFQAIAFGLYIMPLNFMWEKLWGLHQAHYLKRIAVRIPIGCLLWLLALMFPFFGPLNSVIGSLFMSFSVFIIPTLVYTYTFWTPAARQVIFDKQISCAITQT